MKYLVFPKLDKFLSSLGKKYLVWKNAPKLDPLCPTDDRER